MEYLEGLKKAIEICEEEIDIIDFTNDVQRSIIKKTHIRHIIDLLNDEIEMNKTA